MNKFSSDHSLTQAYKENEFRKFKYFFVDVSFQKETKITMQMLMTMTHHFFLSADRNSQRQVRVGLATEHRRLQPEDHDRRHQV